MYFVFYLDDIEIEEPQGFADIVLNMKRDDNWHGVFFEASTSELAFYGIAAAYLKNKKEAEGLKSDVTFKAMQACGIYDELETIFEGKLDFGKYSESCGNVCMVRIPVEQTGCIMTLRNRYDQKVDLDAIVTFNKLSALQQYTELGQTINLPAIAINAAVTGRVADAGYNLDCDFLYGNATWFLYERPNYAVETSNTINTGQLEAVNNIETGLGQEQMSCVNGPLTPQLLLEEPEGIRCFNGDFAYHSRMKGSINLSTFGDQNLGLVEKVKHVIIQWDGVTGSIISNGGLVAEHTIADFTGAPVSPPHTILFDDTLDGTIALADGEGLYAVIDIELVNGGGISGININTIWDKETDFNVSATKLCPDTEVEYYMIHELLSRITESITDNCLKAKSDYYGRTDSQPYNSNEDGCGSLRFLTSGLKIRRATNPAFFASLKDIFEGLRGIDNIGMGIEPNPYIVG
jgi:hypothetical protein